MMIGLDNTGKSTIVNRIHFGKFLKNIRPTIGFNLDDIDF